MRNLRLAAHRQSVETLLPGGRALRLLRRCLGCLAMFESEWAGERICRRCKTKAHWRTGLPQVLE